MSVPWIGSRPPTAPPEPKYAVEFLGDCDLCGGINARWRAVASTTPDYSRSKIEYTVTHSGCTEEAAS